MKDAGVVMRLRTFDRLSRLGCKDPLSLYRVDMTLIGVFQIVGD